MVEENTIKEIILVAIPTVAGIITSKWITSEWQSRKEKNEIKRSVLEKFETIYGGMYGIIAAFNERLLDICTNYDIDPNAKTQTVEQKISQSTIQQGILNQVNADFVEFQKKFYEKYYSVAYLEGELHLYYEIDDLDNKLQKLEDYLFAAYSWITFLVNSKNVEDFVDRYKKCQANLANIGNEYRIMESDIIKEKIIVR